MPPPLSGGTECPGLHPRLLGSSPTFAQQESALNSLPVSLRPRRHSCRPSAPLLLPLLLVPVLTRLPFLLPCPFSSAPFLSHPPLPLPSLPSPTSLCTPWPLPLPSPSFRGRTLTLLRWTSEAEFLPPLIMSDPHGSLLSPPVCQAFSLAGTQTPT